jgi:uroporphyrinogen III methyltransferase/synthase
VALVGAGAGDPGLLAVRAAQLLRAADLVLVDSRVDDAVLADVREDAEVVRTEPGEVQGAALVAASRDGRTAVRLLPGDPYATAEGLKEAEAVLKARQRLEVVPGVTLEQAVPASAGVAATTPRTVARVDDSTPWRALAAAPGTLVLLATAADVAKSAASLVEHGRKGGEAVSVTVGGTTSEQRTVTATLDSVESVLADLSGEAVVVVGDAVKKADRHAWFESRALYGWRVLVPAHPRPGRRAVGGPAVVRRRAGRGADHRRRAAAHPAPMERAVKGLHDGKYAWVAFTSVNAVKAVREKLEEYGLDARALSGVKVAAVGDATAQALLDFGIRADLVPSGQQSSEGLLAGLGAVRRRLRPDRPGLPAAGRHRDRHAARRPAGAGLAGRRRDGLPDRARRAAARRDARGAQGRRVRRGALHELVDRAQPRRHRRQAARHDDPRGDRPADRGDGQGARPARRRPVAQARRRDAGRGAGRLRRRAPQDDRRAPERRAPAQGGAGREEVTAFPAARPRRLRRTPALRRLVADVHVRPERPGAAGVRQGGHRAPAPDRVDAGGRPAHPRLAAQGRRRGCGARASAG